MIEYNKIETLWQRDRCGKRVIVKIKVKDFK